MPIVNNDTIDSLLAEAEGLVACGDYANAESIASKILEQAHIQPENLAKANLVISALCKNSHRIEEAILHARNALRFAEGASNVQLEAEAYLALANAAIDQGNHTEARSAIALMTDRAKIAGDQGVEAMAVYLNSIIYFKTGEYIPMLEQAMLYLSIVEEINDKKKGKQRLIMAFNIIGTSYLSLCDYSQALQYLHQSYELAEASSFKPNIITGLMNIGIAYHELHDYPQALEYMSRAKEIAQQIGQPRSLAKTVGNIGVVLTDEGKYHEALDHLEQALAISEELSLDIDKGYWLHGIARLQYKLGMLDLAHEGFLRTLNHRRSIRDSKHGMANTLSTLGELLIEQGKLEQGLAYLREAIDVSEKSGERRIVAESHKVISAALSRGGNYVGALEHHQKYHEVEMEMFDNEARKKAEIVNIRIAIAEKVKEREMEKMKREQIEKELATASVHLAMQTELLGNFRNRLREIVRKIDEPLEALKKIKEELKTLPCEQIDWIKFEKQFTDVHPEFKAILIEKYPDLTKQEVKMCQLARLGLKNFEMSRLLCISERSVETHRFNLRKKLGLKTEQKLSDFLVKLK